jgi:hypothetical protein
VTPIAYDRVEVDHGTVDGRPWGVYRWVKRDRVSTTSRRRKNDRRGQRRSETGTGTGVRG